MIKIQMFIIIAFLFSSCSKKKDIPAEIHKFSQEAIEASINTYPPKDFYRTYFDKSVPKEYINKLNANAIVWRGMEHNIELRKANLINQHGENLEYLLKYWVEFKENRKFSYSINVLEKDGKMALKRFEPLDVNIPSTFYSRDTNYDIPDFESNIAKIFFNNLSIIATLLIIIVLAVRQRKYLLLLTIPLLFFYHQKMTVFSFNGIDISDKIQFGLPLFQNIDLYFTSISLKTIGVFCVWAIIGLFVIFSVKSQKKHTKTI